MTIAWRIPFELTPSSQAVHEGHGGAGPSVEFTARHQPYSSQVHSPYTGVPLLTIRPWTGGGLNVWWSGTSESVLNDHGTVAGPPLAAPRQTAPGGTASLTYQVKQEQGNQQGPERTEVARIAASVSVRDLLAQVYDLTPPMLPFLVGERLAYAHLEISWHDPPGWMIDRAGAGSHVWGQKCGDLGGEWILEGTYDQSGMHGVQRWTITIDASGGTEPFPGTYSYTDDASGRPTSPTGQVAPVTVYVEGRASGTVTLRFDDEGRALMHLKESHHTYNSWTTLGAKGADRNADLVESDLTWEVGGVCP
jgi:hypothetical protein